MRLFAFLFLLATACGGSSFESEMFGKASDAGEAGVEAGDPLDASADDVIELSCKLPAQQTIGDCVVAVCDGDAAILVSDPTDLPQDDSNPCTDEICTTGGPYGLLQPAHSKKVPGTPCGEGKTCTVSGYCS